MAAHEGATIPPDPWTDAAAYGRANAETFDFLTKARGALNSLIFLCEVCPDDRALFDERTAAFYRAIGQAFQARADYLQGADMLAACPTTRGN